MKRVDWNQIGAEDRKQVLARPKIERSESVRSIVEGILHRVKNEGDIALFELTRKYDGVDLDSIGTPQRLVDDAELQLTEESREAIETAREAIQLFHIAQTQPDLTVETNPGVNCRLLRKPIAEVGLYIPGGTAPLVSSVLMMAVPARIAGCKRVILCTPPPVNPAILYAASICGVNEIYQVGGAQAVAAMAFGSESIRPVAKIFGPGNSYVTEAKRQVASDLHGAAVDMVAGPTELMVIADDSAEPDFVAADLLSQAEHGVDSQVVLVTPSTGLAEAVRNAVAKQLPKLPRSRIASEALQSSTTIICNSINEAAEIANMYAPEHLIINTSDPESVVDEVRNAGSVFLGQWTPESVGDYASGTNHVLPTNGSAASSSGLTLSDFQKTITVQRLSPEGITRIGPVVERLARMEELEGHREAVSVRLRHLRSGMKPPKK